MSVSGGAVPSIAGEISELGVAGLKWPTTSAAFEHASRSHVGGVAGEASSATKMHIRTPAADEWEPSASGARIWAVTVLAVIGLLLYWSLSFTSQASVTPEKGVARVLEQGNTVTTPSAPETMLAASASGPSRLRSKEDQTQNQAADHSQRSMDQGASAERAALEKAEVTPKPKEPLPTASQALPKQLEATGEDPPPTLDALRQVKSKI